MTKAKLYTYNLALIQYIFWEKQLTNRYNCYMICIGRRGWISAFPRKDDERNCLKST